MKAQRVHADASVEALKLYDMKLQYVLTLAYLAQLHAIALHLYYYIVQKVGNDRPSSLLKRITSPMTAEQLSAALIAALFSLLKLLAF